MNRTLVVLASSGNDNEQTPQIAADHEQITVYVNAIIVTAQAARRAVNRWLTWEVGEHIMTGTPELVLGQKLMWRIPIKVTAPTSGVLNDRIYDMMVDAITGEVLDKKFGLQEIQIHVEQLARAIHPSTP